jgi:hypothetical protein
MDGLVFGVYEVATVSEKSGVKLTAHGATIISIKLSIDPRKNGPSSCISEVNPFK